MLPAPRRTLRVITRPGDALGFRLAGATVDEVVPGEEAAALKALLADPTLAVLAIEEEVLAAVPETMLRHAERRGPVVLPFHLPRRWAGSTAGRDYVAALIRRAIGYHVRLDRGERP